jgi:hypothetical protein
MLRHPTLLLLTFVALALTACGGDDGDDAAPPATEIQVVFGAEGMAVTPTTVPSGHEVSLSVSAQDGRPHGVTLVGAPTQTRVVVKPGETRKTPAGALPDGTYRVAPDGATEPVPVTVGG